MKKPYSLHFQPLRKCANRISVLYVLLLLIGLLGTQGLYAQTLSPSHHISASKAAPVQGTEPAKGKSEVAVNPTGGTNGNEDHTPHLKFAWKAKIFDYQVFTESKGQFDHEFEGNSQRKILFRTQFNNDIKTYMLPNGVLYTHRKLVYVDADKDEDKDEDKGNGRNGFDPDAKHTDINQSVSSIWEGANPNLAIQASEEQPGYSAYAIGQGKGSIMANTFKKLTYQNLYPGIDAIYSFPDKGDIKYTLIVHPGADLSLVKLNYVGAKGLKLNANGSITVDNEISKFTDMAPVAMYEGGGNVKVDYVLNGTEESFVVKGDYDKTKTLVIDPITVTNLGFGAEGRNSGYDLDYDNFGNSFVGGGYFPYGIAKFNAAGTYLWTYWAFTTDNSNGGDNSQIWGDFAVDKNTGMLYCVEGFSPVAGSWIEKVNGVGSNIKTYGGSTTFTEMWRAEFNACNNKIVIGGGGINSGVNSQVAIIDTSLTTLSPQNPIGDNGPGHDVVCMAMDPTGSNCFMALPNSTFCHGCGCPSNCYNGPDQTGFDANYIFATPVAAPTTTSFAVSDGYGFGECSSVNFVGAGNGYTNGMNGMAASPNWLYMYDGKTIRQYNKVTGAVQATTVNVPGGSKYNQGGIAADGCDNVYVGDGNDIYIYNSSPSLSFNTNTALSGFGVGGGTIYALRLGKNDATLWATGQGFLIEFVNPFASIVATASLVANTSCGLPNGSATAGLSLCSGPAAGVTYSWMPGGQTTQTATGLASGTYTVTMATGCGNKYTATVTIGASVAPSLSISVNPSATICAGQSTVLSGHGGTAGSYTWSPGTALSCTSCDNTTANPTSAQTYTLTDALCPTYTTSLTINVNPTPPTPTIGSNSPICAGQNLNLNSSAAGATGYTWAGPNAFTSNIASPTITAATAAATGTYTVTATEGGCSSPTNTVSVTVNALPANPVASAVATSVCAGGTINLTTSSGGPTYSWSGPNGFTSNIQNPTISGVTAAAGGTYSLTVTSGAGCNSAVPGTVTITVNPVPAAPTANSNSPVCAGQNITFTSSGVGSIYSWTGPNGFTSNVQNPTLVAATGAATGTYSVTYASVAGCPSVAGTTPVVVNALPATPTGGSNSPICAGATLNLTSSSVGATTYSWAGPSGFTSNIQNPSIVGATTAATGVYTVTAKSAAGCAAAATFTISVTVNPIPPTPSPGGNSPVCSGQTINLTSSSAGATGYIWAGPNGFTSNVQNPNITNATVAATGVYTVTASAAGCTSPQGVISITVNPTPAAPSPGSNSPICAGSALNLTAGLGSSTYNWTGPNGFTSTTQNPTINPATAAAAGTYTVTTSSALGCKSANATILVVVNPLPPAPSPGSNSPICSGSNLNLTSSAAGATSYTWSGPNSFTSAVQNPTITAATTAATGVYTVTAKEGTCVGPSATIPVVVNPTPTLSIAPVAVTMCPGATTSVTASNTAGAGSYTWTPNTAIAPTTGATVVVSPTVTTTYTVNETSSLGCPALPQTLVVTIANTLTVTVNPAAPTICDGNSVVLNALGASTFTWRNIGTGLSCTTCPNPTANPTTTTTYTVVGKSGSCSDSTKVTVSVNPTPTINIVISGIAASICPGDSMGMTASGAGTGGTYVWTPTTGLSCTSCPNPNAGPGSTTTYTVTGTNSLTCSSTATQVITVYPKPVISITASKPVICAGDTTTLHASGITTYNWAPDSELNVQTGPVVIAGPTVTVTYTVSGKGTGGCKTKDSVTVTVNPKPNVTIVPPNPSVCSGTAVPLTASGANGYSWSPTSGLSPTSGPTVTATLTTSTTYTVIGTSLLGCKDTVHETITINPNPTVTVSPATPAICVGDSANLIVSGVGAGATYAWTPATGLNNTNTDSVWTALTTTGTYTVNGTTAAGCKGSATVTVTVGTLTVTAIAAKTTLCSGSSTKITGSGASSFTWKPSSGLSGTTGSIVTATPTASTTYTVIGTSSGGLACSDSAFITITVNTTPTITVTPASKLLCFGSPGDTIHATGAGTGGTYAWKPNIGVANVAGDSTVIVDPSATATYTITGTTALGCPATATFTMTVDKVIVTATTVPSPASICAGSSLTITAKGATNYVWTPKNGLNDTNTAVVIDTAMSSFTYKVVGTDALGCKDSANVPVTVNPLPIVKITTADSILCNGGSTILNATGASTYTWLPAIGLTPASGSSVSASPSGTVVYTVTGTSAANCSSTASISITINTTPTVGISLSGGNTLCSGQPYTMTGTGATSYTWSPATGLNTTTGATVRDSITTGPITYKVVGSNGTCKDSATATLNVFSTLVVTPVPDSMCSGKNDSAVVQVNVTGGDPTFTYSWSSGITGTGPGPYKVGPGSTTTYTCTVTDACGTVSSATDTIKVNIAPVAGFIPTPDTIMGGQFVAFVDTSKNGTSWLWTFGDGGTSDSAFPYYQYVQQGQYVVVLVVSNSTGCTDTAIHIVYVTEGIFVPNVFTPNGDGVNDEFHVTAGSLKTYHIEIFNRWGERVFMADSPATNWDGRSTSGVQESDGDYYYIIKATDYDNKPFNLNGYIQLIRN